MRLPIPYRPEADVLAPLLQRLQDLDWALASGDAIGWIGQVRAAKPSAFAMETLLREVIRLKADDAQAYNALGYSLADRGVRLDEAHQLVSKALELAPNDPFISDSLGWVEFKRGRLQEAIQILDKAFQSKPDPEIAAHLGEVLWVAGQRSRATAIWKQGVALSRDNETLQDTMRRFNVKP